MGQSLGTDTILYQSQTTDRSRQLQWKRGGMNSANLVLNNSECFRHFDDVSDENGLALNGVYLPREILVLILSFVHPITVAKRCKYVCKNWYNVTPEVWKAIAERRYSRAFGRYHAANRMPWCVYRDMALHGPYERNLLKNDSGQLGFAHWEKTIEGGDKWAVESPPIGVERSDATVYKSAFVTTYMQCGKKQVFDLVRLGINKYVLDKIRPPIVVSECCARRWDCTSIYKLRVLLQDKNYYNIGEFEHNEDFADWVGGWKKVEHTFNSYGPGIRYIVFEHFGRDSQYWAGHYGSKMCHAVVTIPLKGLLEYGTVEVFNTVGY